MFFQTPTQALEITKIGLFATTYPTRCQGRQSLMSVSNWWCRGQGSTKHPLTSARTVGTLGQSTRAAVLGILAALWDAAKLQPTSTKFQVLGHTWQAKTLRYLPRGATAFPAPRTAWLVSLGPRLREETWCWIRPLLGQGTTSYQVISGTTAISGLWRKRHLNRIRGTSDGITIL